MQALKETCSSASDKQSFYPDIMGPLSHRGSAAHKLRILATSQTTPGAELLSGFLVELAAVRDGVCGWFSIEFFASPSSWIVSERFFLPPERLSCFDPAVEVVF